MADAKKPDKQAPKTSPGQAGAKKPAAPGKGGKGAPAPAAAPTVQARVTGDVPPRLRDRFRATVIPALMKERGYTNPFQVPRMEKIVINIDRFGNTTAGTIPLALNDAVQSGRLKRGDLVLLADGYANDRDW